MSVNISSTTLPVILAALASGLFALAGVVVTSFLAKRREHETEWRQTKAAHYQEYMSALSAMVSGRSTPAAQERYADAVNALSLVAPAPVLEAVDAFQNEISFRNAARSDERHDILLGAAIQAMRDDIQPRSTRNPSRAFRLLAPPPPDAGTD
jgi:nitrate reductase gamma subunit